MSIGNIITLNPCDANNHILNTLLIKLFFIASGESIFAARLPGLIAFGFYLLYVRRISALIVNVWLGYLSIVLLCFNPFVLDFFGLARGYGLALCFELAAVYYLVSYYHFRSIRNMTGGILFSFLTVLSNFSFLPFMLAYGVVMGFLVTLRDSRKTAVIIALAYVAVSALYYIPLNKLRMNGNLYYGGNAGFYRDTIGTFLDVSTGHHLGANCLGVLQFLVVLLFILIVAINLFKTGYRNREQQMSLLLVALLFIVISIIFAQHYILHTPFPIDRTAVYLFPLFVIAIVFNANSLSLILVRSDYIVSILSCIVTMIVFLNFSVNANIYKTITWEFESRTTTMLDYIEAKGEKLNTIYRIDNSWPLNRSLEWYTRHGRYPHIIKCSKSDRNSICDSCDYYLFVCREMPNVLYDSQKEKVFNVFKIIELDWQKDNVLLLSAPHIR